MWHLWLISVFFAESSGPGNLQFLQKCFESYFVVAIFFQTTRAILFMQESLLIENCHRHRLYTLCGTRTQWVTFSDWDKLLLEEGETTKNNKYGCRDMLVAFVVTWQPSALTTDQISSLMPCLFRHFCHCHNCCPFNSTLAVVSQQRMLRTCECMCTLNIEVQRPANINGWGISWCPSSRWYWCLCSKGSHSQNIAKP